MKPRSLIVLIILPYLTAAQINPMPPITFLPLSSSTSESTIATSNTSSHPLGGSIFTTSHSTLPLSTLPLSTSFSSSENISTTSSPTTTVGTSSSAASVLTSPATLPSATSAAASSPTSQPSSAMLHLEINALVIIINALLVAYLF